MKPSLPEWGLSPRQQFGQRMRELKEAAGLEGQRLGELLGIGGDGVTRIERGERWPVTSDVVASWARETGLNDEQAATLIEDFAEAKALETRLRSATEGARVAQKAQSKLLGKAKRVRTLAVTEVPSYLQRPEYAQQLLGIEADFTDVIAARQSDGEAVGRPGKYFEILFFEAALRVRPCDARAMRRQLSRLQELIGIDGVEFGVIPLGVRLGLPLKCSFTLYDSIAVVETYAGAVDLTAKRAPAYVELMDRLWDDAVRGEAVREVLTAAANALPAS